MRICDYPVDQPVKAGAKTSKVSSPLSIDHPPCLLLFFTAKSGILFHSLVKDCKPFRAVLEVHYMGWKYIKKNTRSSARSFFCKLTLSPARRREGLKTPTTSEGRCGGRKRLSLQHMWISTCWPTETGDPLILHKRGLIEMRTKDMGYTKR